MKSKSFSEFCNLKEVSQETLEKGTNTADMRMARPVKYDFERQMNLIGQLQDPKNKEAIAKVLSQHPELAATLSQMIKDAVLNHDDVFGRGEAGMDLLHKIGDRKASDIVGSFSGKAPSADKIFPKGLF